MFFRFGKGALRQDLAKGRRVRASLAWDPAGLGEFPQARLAGESSQRGKGQLLERGGPGSVARIPETREARYPLACTQHTRETSTSREGVREGGKEQVNG